MSRLNFDSPDFADVLAKAAHNSNNVIGSNGSKAVITAPKGRWGNRFAVGLNVFLRTITFGKVGVTTTYAKKSMTNVAKQIQSHPELFSVTPDKPKNAENVLNMEVLLNRYVTRENNPEKKKALNDILTKCNFPIKEAKQAVYAEKLKELEGYHVGSEDAKIPGSLADFFNSAEALPSFDIAGYSTLATLVAKYGTSEMAKKLLAAPMDQVQLDKVTDILIRECMGEKGNHAILETLHEEAKAKGTTDKFYLTVSTSSNLLNKMEFVELLINNNRLTYDYVDKEGNQSTNLLDDILRNPPRTDAQKSNLMEAAKLILKKDKTLVNKQSTARQTPALTFAAIYGMPRLVKMFLNAKADTAAKNPITGNNPIQALLGTKVRNKDNKEILEAAEKLVKGSSKEAWEAAGLITAADKDKVKPNDVWKEFQKQWNA